MNDDSDLQVAQLRKAPAERWAARVWPAAGLTWTAAQVLHMAGVQGARDAGIAVAVAASLAFGAAGRGRAPAPLPTWIAVAGGWLSAAWYFGPLAWWPAPVLTCLAVIIAWTASRAAHRHPGVVSAREWREAKTGWLTTSHDWNLSGTHLLDYQRIEGPNGTSLGEIYDLSTKGTGKLASTFVSRKLEEYIAQTEDLPPGRVTISLLGLAGRIRIRVRRTEPWTGAVLHPLVDTSCAVALPFARSILDEALVGQDPETDEPLAVPLADENGGKNVSVTSIKGGGKGVLFDDLAEWVTACPDAIMVRINTSFKGYAEAESWGPSCYLTAFGEEQKSRAAAVLKAVIGIAEWRARNYKRGRYVPTPEDPAIIVFIDESDSSASVAAIREGMEAIATKGREYFVSYVHAGQRGTAQYSSAKARSQDDVACTGLVKNANEARHAGGAASGPDMSTYGEGKPGVWKVSRLGGGSRTGRSWVFDASPLRHAEAVERIAEERAYDQGDVPEACKEYLGDSLAVLLASEVFAKWDRNRNPDACPDDDAPEAGTTAGGSPATAAPASPQDPVAAIAAPAPAGRTAVAERDEFEEWARMNMDPVGSARNDAVHERLGRARQELEEAMALPRTSPVLSPEELAARTAARWETEIPAGSRPRLLAMLDEGTTARMVAEEFGIAKLEALKWLRACRTDGVAYLDGQKRGQRWRRAAPPPGDGDAE